MAFSRWWRASLRVIFKVPMVAFGEYIGLFDLWRGSPLTRVKLERRTNQAFAKVAKARRDKEREQRTRSGLLPQRDGGKISNISSTSSTARQSLYTTGSNNRAASEGPMGGAACMEASGVPP